MKISIKFLLAVLLFTAFGYGGEVKKIDVGLMRASVVDNCHQSDQFLDNKGLATYEFAVAQYNSETSKTYRINGVFIYYLIRRAGLYMGVKNWRDASGTVHPYYIAGAGYDVSDETDVMFAVPDKNKNTIKRYRRHPKANIIVYGSNGLPIYLADPFPFDEMDEVNPAKINEISPTADMLIESRARTWIGLDVHQRVLGWGQKNHDDYVVWDMIFKNTGNIDLDDQIELPGQTLDSLYVMRATNLQPNPGASREWLTWKGCRASDDTLRIIYAYSYRLAGAFDDLGNWRQNDRPQWLSGPQFAGEVTLFASNGTNKCNYATDDNPAQPQMHSALGTSTYITMLYEDLKNHYADYPTIYRMMQYGLQTNDVSQFVKPALMPNTHPNTYHELPPDTLYEKVADMRPTYSSNHGKRSHTLGLLSYGPYNLAYGDSIRIVYAMVIGTISKRAGMDIIAKRIDPTYNTDIYTAKGPLYPPSMDTTKFKWSTVNAERIDNLPPQYKRFPRLMSDNGSGAPKYANWAKDCWVMTGKDTLFRNAWFAIKNFKSGYAAAPTPPAPSITVKGLADYNRIVWGNEADSYPYLDAFCLYRSIGSFSDTATFEKLGEFPKTVHLYNDSSAVAGQSYYYYVSSVTNSYLDVNGVNERLESNKYENLTTAAVTKATRPCNDLDSIRVVPNPYNIGAPNNLFTGQVNKLTFRRLPAFCTIKIYTESGDLVKVIEHINESDTEVWGSETANQDLMKTRSGQRPVSGIYIARIVTPEGKSKNVKFVIVR